MPDRPSSRSSRSGRSSRGRSVARHRAPRRGTPMWSVLANPVFSPAIITMTIFFFVVAATIGFTHDRLRVSEGRVSDETRAVRVEFQVPDPAATQRKRDERRMLTPRVYTLDETVRLELRSSLQALPAALAAAATLDDVAPEIRESYKLTSEQLEAIHAQGETAAETDAWAERVDSLMHSLYRRPLLASEEFQLALEDPATRMELRIPAEPTIFVHENRALNAEGDLSRAMRAVVRESGFRGSLRELIENRLLSAPKPMFIFDPVATEEVRTTAADAIPEQMITYTKGALLIRRGEKISSDAFDLIRREHESFMRMRSEVLIALRWLGGAGVSLVITIALAIYLGLFYPGLMRSPRRLGGFVCLVGGAALVATWAAALRPETLWATAMAPIIFASMMTVVMFDPRLGLASAVVQAAVLGAAVSPPLGFFVAALAGVGVSSWVLREVRSRSDVVRASVWVGIAVAISTALLSLISRPLVDAVWLEIAFDMIRAGAGGFVAGAFGLVVLPTFERFFDRTTGMTLSELRDPKQPLLRELQQKAPGSFNHSHTVATLAEAAADAIGADGLHVYVGALYHDIGKMNKPDYFVENQTPGFNRHSKLSPAMSLLVIVGHVKDGVELAKQYGLPLSLIRYIETHHGTTLVSYFYDQARKKAQADESGEAPEEIEYRYPGPKPHTREQAILMLCDAVESATRALPEPTPSRITALVHELATKRLLDGQFDESDLTLRDLRLIEDAIIKALCALYHGRIAYPKETAREQPKDEQQQPESDAPMEQTA